MTYDLKDSGGREQFASGAVRDLREGKGRFDLVTPVGLRRLAVVYEKGAIKYAARNWEAGMPLSRCLDSAERHINQYKEGKTDEDHLAQAAWNLFAAMHFEELRPDLQDLPTRMKTPPESDPEPLTIAQALDLDPTPLTPTQISALDKLKLFLTGGVPSADTSGPKVP